MNQDQWNAVDQYITDIFVPRDEALERALQASAQAGLPPINVTPAQGKLLHLLARARGARAILELGTLGGYSTIWLARALSTGGRVVTLESEPKHAVVADSNITFAGLKGVVDLRLGPALETLPGLVAERFGPFDFIFIDADKEHYPEYFVWALKLSRPGTLILADNVVRSGAVIEAANEDPNVRGVRRFNELVAAEPCVNATMIQTVGSKGYDGFTLILVTTDVPDQPSK